jgi:hypothetical protein
MKNVGFLIDCGFKDWYEFGYSESLYAWFSNIAYHLEDGKWGSIYPIVMNKFYYDEENGVPYKDIDTFQKEIEQIEEKFKTIPSSKAIWSFEDKIYSLPENMPNVNYEAKYLNELFVSNRGSNICTFSYKVLRSLHFWHKEDNCNAKLIIREENNI